MVEKTFDGYKRDSVTIHKDTFLAKVFGALLESDVSLSAREISIATGVSDTNTRSALNQLQSKGWVKRLHKSRDNDGRIGYKWTLAE